MAVNTRVLREGIIAGLLGAGGVAVWFLGVDLVAGSPLRTPSTLGRVMLSVFGSTADYGTFWNAALYTVFHVGAFMILGVIASMLVDGARRMPQMAAGLMLFFVVFEVGFYFVAMGLSQYDIMGSVLWYQIAAANLVAALLMGRYFWRKHPELKVEAKLALGDRI